MMKQAMPQKLTDWQWQAVSTKNSELDGVFYFGVQTTGVFCRPSCSSRSPKRENVSFFVTSTDAERAGFRACLRCKPKQEFHPDAAVSLVTRAFELLQHDEITTIDELATKLEALPEPAPATAANEETNEGSTPPASQLPSEQVDQTE